MEKQTKGMVNLIVKLNHKGQDKKEYVLNNITYGETGMKVFSLPQGFEKYSFWRMDNNEDEITIFVEDNGDSNYVMFTLFHKFKAFFTLGTQPLEFIFETSEHETGLILLKVTLVRYDGKVEKWEMFITDIKIDKK